MIKTLQDILNGMRDNFIALSTAYINYRKIGRSTSDIEQKIVVLFNLYSVFPYMENTQDDINRAQYIINITQL